MTALLIVVLIVFVGICVGGMRRAMAAFGWSFLMRVCGAILFVASVFVALTAVPGGVTLALGIDKFPARWLVGTPFRSYVVPGLILAVMVGGSATVAAASVARKSEKGALLATAAGVILLGWLLGERVILPKAAFDPRFFSLEAVYVGAGLLMVVPGVVVRIRGRRVAASKSG